MQYNLVASSEESTVVAEYTPVEKPSDSYQSEAQLEKGFIEQLVNQGYEYLRIHEEKDLLVNLRSQLEALNHYRFSDSEWDRFFTSVLANANEGIVEKTRKIQEDHIQDLRKDDGSTKNIILIDKKQIHNNRLQVINQYVQDDGTHPTRYDVTLLVNGLPLVHVELKRRGVAIREAFNQINRYQRDSFWASSGLFEFVQIFIISNGTNTKYYSNTTRFSHIKEASGRKPGGKKTSNSFEFTSYWADAKNRTIPDLEDFTKTFLSKHTILNVLTKYCVFTSENLLLVMRPYQIVATERIINRIVVSNNYKQMGTIKAGGYVWHTTGSGKTLTSFKTAQIASNLPFVDKVLFVVDRKDLDYQTMKEYDRFEKGAANGNKSTSILQRQLEDKDKDGNPHDYKIIITTIQKLATFVKKNRSSDVSKKHVVIIFDECHRSQFGAFHEQVTSFFKNYHLFGFTGTPIFSINSVRGTNPSAVTTPQVFGDQLHSYTIVDAINDGNVLPFRIDYVNTIREKDGGQDVDVKAIDTEKALEAPQRITNVVAYILDHFEQKTKRTQRGWGFNSIFAVSSIPVLMKYYTELKKQIMERHKNLTIATIYSFADNEPDFDGDDGGGDGADGLDKNSRDFLDDAIKDYNETFHTRFDTSSAKFENYYKDISDRMKKQQIDILLVVNMFLTGFDATTLNTLWVDKNLRMHGLIQAFSRTNRILNSVKTFGNIVCFRNLQKETEDALALFGDKDASGVVLLKGFNDYYNGFDDDQGKHHEGYAEIVERLQTQFPLDQPIVGENNEKEFVRTFGQFLALQNILSAFDDFKGKEILSSLNLQNYQSLYLDLHDKWLGKGEAEKADINDDLVFEMELVKQVEVNIDYILMLVDKYHDGNCKDKTILTSIRKAVDSSTELRSKKELIETFISRVNVDTEVDADWRQFVLDEEKKDLDAIIKDERLKPEQTRMFISNCFRDGEVKTSGTAIDSILPPMTRFGGGGQRDKKKMGVIAKLKAFFEKFFGLGIFEGKEDGEPKEVAYPMEQNENAMMVASPEVELSKSN